VATLSIHYAGRTHTFTLPPTAIVGRSGACHVRVPDSGVPMHWLELRWSEGAWRWRTLAGELRTRGVGMLLADGWRQLPITTPARPQRIRLDDELVLELIEGSPPERFLQDLVTGEVFLGAAIGEFVEVGVSDLRAFEVEGEPVPPFRDGDVVIHEGRALRVHLPDTPEPTGRAMIDLRRAGASLELDDTLRATLHQHGVEAAITGEHVRTLAAYARARRTDSPTGGWLDTDTAWRLWLQLGGNPNSPATRLGWDRGRCRSHLTRVGVTGVEALFETRRMRGVTEIRLGLPVE
jgi:hypothetical protein